MAEQDEVNKRINTLEEGFVWLKDRVWYGAGNLHDRVHTLEDRSADRKFEVEKLQGDVKKIERVLGLDGTYGEKSIMSDLREALEANERLMETLNRLKENMITVKDFQTLLQDVKTLKERGQAQITFWNFIQLGFVSAAIGLIIDFIKSLVGAP